MKTLVSNMDEIPEMDEQSFQLTQTCCFFGNLYSWQLINMEDNTFRLLFDEFEENSPSQKNQKKGKSQFCLEIMLSPIQMKKYFYFYESKDHAKIKQKLQSFIASKLTKSPEFQKFCNSFQVSDWKVRNNCVVKDKNKVGFPKISLKLTKFNSKLCTK